LNYVIYIELKWGNGIGSELLGGDKSQAWSSDTIEQLGYHRKNFCFWLSFNSPYFAHGVCRPESSNLIACSPPQVNAGWTYIIEQNPGSGMYCLGAINTGPGGFNIIGGLTLSMARLFYYIDLIDKRADNYHFDVKLKKAALLVLPD